MIATLDRMFWQSVTFQASVPDLSVSSRSRWPVCRMPSGRDSIVAVDRWSEHGLLVPNDLSQKSTSESPCPEVSQRSGRPRSAVLTGEDADPGVLRLEDVVEDLDLRPRDGVAAGDGAGGRPEGERALGAAGRLVDTRVDQHEVVDDAVRLVVVAVTVGVGGILAVIVGPGERGVLRDEGVDRVDGGGRAGCPGGPPSPAGRCRTSPPRTMPRSAGP